MFLFFRWYFWVVGQFKKYSQTISIFHFLQYFLNGPTIGFYMNPKPETPETLNPKPWKKPQNKTP